MMSWGLASGVFELKLCVGPPGGLRRWKRDVGQWHRGKKMTGKAHTLESGPEQLLDELTETVRLVRIETNHRNR